MRTNFPKLNDPEFLLLNISSELIALKKYLKFLEKGLHYQNRIG